MDETVPARTAQEMGALCLSAPGTRRPDGVHGQIGAAPTSRCSVRCASSLPADETRRRIDLGAPGGRASRSDAPGGPSGAPVPVAAVAGCVTADALASAGAGPARTASLHADELVTSVDRDAHRARSLQPAVEAAAMSENSNASPWRWAFRRASRTTNLIAAFAVSGIRSDPAAVIGGSCEGETELPGVEACFAVFDTVNGLGILTSIGRDRPPPAKEPRRAVLIAMDDSRVAL